jgi:hypothetical protein
MERWILRKKPGYKRKTENTEGTKGHREKNIMVESRSKS